MADGKESDAGAVVERGVRLSESSLWTFQRRFFDQRGIEAWSQGIVPTHVTSNAYVAEAYARIAMRFLHDCLAQPAGSPLAIDREQPVYVVELGAGSGYLAYLFLNKLIEQQRHGSFPAPGVCYVATDFTGSNVEQWKKHPCFEPLAEYGLFDVATFDAESDEAIELQISGTTLRAGEVANPMIVVANYLFDTIYHDVYRVKKGVLEEGLTTLRAATDVTGENALDGLSIEFEYEPVEGSLYDEPLLDEILSEYAEQLGDTAFPFPIGGLRCLRAFERLAGGRFLVLSADKGHTDLYGLAALPDPAIVHHGSVSMMVNYHALGRYLERSQGGFLLANSDRQSSLEIVAMATASPESLPETRTAFWEAVERFGPIDAFTLSGATLYKPTFEQVMALIRLSAFDPASFAGIAPMLHKTLGDPTAAQRRQLKRAMSEIWRLYFPLSDSRDIPFELGFVCYMIEAWAEAQYFYQQSLTFHGEHHATFYNMGLCQYRLGQLRQSLRYFERALDLDPAYGPARNWRLRVQSELDGGEPLLPQVEPEEAAAPAPTEGQGGLTSCRGRS